MFPISRINHLNFEIKFSYPQKALSCAEPRRITYKAVVSCAIIACNFFSRIWAELVANQCGNSVLFVTWCQCWRQFCHGKMSVVGRSQEAKLSSG